MNKWVLGLTSVASLMVALDLLVVATAVSTIRVDLHASLEELEWTVNAYALSFAVLLMTAAALGDRLGRRRVFAAGLALFGVASVACALAPSVGALIAARAVQGAGAAVVMPLAMALLSAAFPPPQRARALGVFSGITGLAVLGGPLVGGAVTEGLAWQWIFWINVPLAAGLIVLVRSRLAESFGPRTAMDGGGLVLQGVGALGVVWALVRGNSAGWTSPEVVVSLLVGLAATAGFVVWELRVPEPMLPIRLFAARGFSAGNGASFLLYASLLSSVFFIAQYLQVSLGYGPLGAGLRLLPWTATLFVVAPVAGRLVNRVGERVLVAGGLFLQAVGLAWLAVSEGYAGMIAPFVVAGVGVSMAMPAAQNAVLGSVPPMALGKASGAFSTLRQLGGAFGVAVVAAVFAATGGYGSARAFADGFGPALGVAAGLSLAAALAGWAIPARRAVPGTAAPAVPVEVGANHNG